MKVLAHLAVLTLVTLTPSASATSQEDLFTKVVAASQCNQTVNNGLICDYKVDKDLWFSIKDAGGADTVVGFNKSNIDANYYAVLYFGCIAVVPGKAHSETYSTDLGAFVSPMNGRVYRTIGECKAAR